MTWSENIACETALGRVSGGISAISIPWIFCGTECPRDSLDGGWYESTEEMQTRSMQLHDNGRQRLLQRSLQRLKENDRAHLPMQSCALQGRTCKSLEAVLSTLGVSANNSRPATQAGLPFSLPHPVMIAGLNCISHHRTAVANPRMPVEPRGTLLPQALTSGKPPFPRRRLSLTACETARTYRFRREKRDHRVDTAM